MDWVSLWWSYARFEVEADVQIRGGASAAGLFWGDDPWNNRSTSWDLKLGLTSRSYRRKGWYFASSHEGDLVPYSPAPEPALDPSQSHRLRLVVHDGLAEAWLDGVSVWTSGRSPTGLGDWPARGALGLFVMGEAAGHVDVRFDRFRVRDLSPQPGWSHPRLLWPLTALLVLCAAGVLLGRASLLVTSSVAAGVLVYRLALIPLAGVLGWWLVPMWAASTLLLALRLRRMVLALLLPGLAPFVLVPAVLARARGQRELVPGWLHRLERGAGRLEGQVWRRLAEWHTDADRLDRAFAAWGRVRDLLGEDERVLLLRGVLGLLRRRSDERVDVVTDLMAAARVGSREAAQLLACERGDSPPDVPGIDGRLDDAYLGLLTERSGDPAGAVALYEARVRRGDRRSAAHVWARSRLAQLGRLRAEDGRET